LTYTHSITGGSHFVQGPNNVVGPTKLSQ